MPSHKRFRQLIASEVLRRRIALYGEGPQAAKTAARAGGWTKKFIHWRDYENGYRPKASDNQLTKICRALQCSWTDITRQHHVQAALERRKAAWKAERERKKRLRAERLPPQLRNLPTKKQLIAMLHEPILPECPTFTITQAMEQVYRWPDFFARYVTQLPDKDGQKQFGFDPYPYQQLIGREVTLAIARGGGKIGINVPSRHGKSEFCSKWIPIWFLDNFPEKKVILVSYAAELAEKYGKDVRNEFSRNKRLRTKLREDSQAANMWRTPQGGGMLSVGIGGGVLGFGGDLIIVDDALKGWLEARSDIVRRDTIEYFRSTLMSRLEAGGTILVVQQRLHINDLCGFLMTDESQKDQWKWIRIPAIAEESDPMGRQPGEALCPRVVFPDGTSKGRFNIADLHRMRAGMTREAWEAMFQQNPIPDGGARFKRDNFRYYSTTPDGKFYRLSNNLDGSNEWLVKVDACDRFAVMDPAGTDRSQNERACYTVIQVWDVAPSGDMILVDQYREQVETPDAADAAVRMCRKYDVAYLAVEKDGIGLGIIQNIKAGKNVAVKSIKARGSKEARSETAEIRMAAGMVHFPKGAPFVQSLEWELLAFPNGEYMDQADCISHAAKLVQGLKGAPRDASDQAWDAKQEADEAEAGRVQPVGASIRGGELTPGGSEDQALAWLLRN